MKTFPWKRLKIPILLWFAALLSGAVLGGCTVNPVTGRSELALVNMTSAEEVALGKPAYRQAIQKNGGIFRNSALRVYVDAVGQRLARQSHRPDLPFRFVVVNDSSPNAFALPGGYIAITRGLLANLSNEAELAAVLGHEIGHVTARHSLQGMQRSTLLGATVGILGGLADAAGYGWLADQVGGVAANLIDKRYSREQETESDRLGIDYMVKAGYDPVGAVQLQEYFYRQVENGADPQWLNGLFRSHPFSAERLAANRRYIAAKYPAVSGDGQDAVPFARAIESLTQTRQGYTTFDRARKLEQQKKLDEAIALYHQALLEAPDQPLILTSLGLAYLRREDRVPARRYLIKSVNLQDDYFQSRLALGYIYLQKQQYAKARDHLEAGFNLLATLEGAFMLAEAREHTDDKPGARKLYVAVTKADPSGKLGRSAASRLKQMGRL